MTDFGETLHSFRDHVKAITKEIQSKRVEMSFCGDTIKVTALATGDIVDLYISARAVQKFDNATLSQEVLTAVRKTAAKAKATSLESAAALTGGAATLDELADAGNEIKRELAEDRRRERERPTYQARRTRRY